jgi:hypothetical protein
MLSLSSTPLAGKQKTILKDAIWAMRGVYQDARDIRHGIQARSANGRMWQRFEHVGGPSGYRDLFYTSEDRTTQIDRELNKDWTDVRALATNLSSSPVMEWLSDYNLTMENSMRLAVFKTGVESGLTDIEAASVAKNITVNFNKKGQWGAQLGALYAFFNANVQGTARIAETLFERTPQGFRLSSVGKKIVVGGLLVGVLQTFALAMAGYDDDDPPEFVKQKNLIFPMPWTEKKYAMIPMPLGFNLLPTIGRLAAETVKAGVQGKDLKIASHLATLFGSMFNALAPTGGSGGALQELAPTIVDPLVALTTNKDWTGRNISKEDISSLDPTPGRSRAHDTATPWGKGLSTMINWATGGTDYVPGVVSPTPDAIDYLIGQFTGGIGREVGKAAQVATSTYTGEEMPLHKVPGLGRFVGSATGSSAVRTRFYENIKQSNMAYNELIGRAEHKEPFAEYLKTHPDARFAKAGIEVQKDLGQLQKQKKLMLERGAGREAVRLQEERITALMRRFNELVEKAETRVP